MQHGGSPKPSGMRRVPGEGGAERASSHLKPLLDSRVVPRVGLRCLSRQMTIVPIGLADLVYGKWENCRIEPVRVYAGRAPLSGGTVECHAALTGRVQGQELTSR